MGVNDDIPDDYALALGVSVAQNAARTHLQHDVLPGCDYIGWVFSYSVYTLEFDGTQLYSIDGSDGMIYELDAKSIGELIDWGILTPIAGNFSLLPIRECPECLNDRYFTQDYICHQCRSASEQAHSWRLLERVMY